MSNDDSKDGTIQHSIMDAIKAMEKIKATTISVPNFEIPRMHQPHESITNPARWTYKRLGEYIKDFEEKLDQEHEIGARLVSFGHSVVFHIENVGYYGPDIISFDGVNDKNERVQLIQHVSQLSVLLVAVQKLDEKPRRIGFIWNDDTDK